MQEQQSQTNQTLTPDAARSCALCQRPLTDAASVETGVGPICRSRSNEALARSFPARFQEAFQLMQIAREKQLLACSIPTLQPTLSSICDALLMDPDARTREDWRIVIKQAEWVLSHNHIGGRVRCLLQDLAEALGYNATAALWRGEMVMGKATLTCVNGHLRLQSPRPNAEVREHLRSSGWKFYPSTCAWELKANSDNKILDAEQFIRSYFFKCQTDEAIQAARQHLAQTQPQAPSMWIKRSDKIIIKAPYNADFIAALKAGIPAPQRAWLAASKEWVVDGTFEDAVRLLLKQYYETRSTEAA